MRITKGLYYPRGSDIKLNIVAVPYQDDFRARIKVIMTNKRNGIVYHDAKYYDVIKRETLHWYRELI